MSEHVNLTEAVREKYASIARRETASCCSGSSCTPAIGYSEADLALAGDANLGLGCGNPLALAEISPGMTVLDLGSGAGFDALLAWQRVGPNGRVIGVDMTDEMLERARAKAAELGAVNVEFRKGYIEQLPVGANSVDLAISNCVINLSSNKAAVFAELYRVLKPGGRFAVSDLVLLRPLPPAVRDDLEAILGCIAGASLLGEYLGFAFAAGFESLTVPQITDGRTLAAAYGLQGSAALADHSAAELKFAASALVSVRLHGRKPRTVGFSETA